MLLLIMRLNIGTTEWERVQALSLIALRLAVVVLGPVM